MGGVRFPPRTCKESKIYKTKNVRLLIYTQDSATVCKRETLGKKSICRYNI